MLEMETHLGAVFCSITEAAMTGGAAHALRTYSQEQQHVCNACMSSFPLWHHLSLMEFIFFFQVLVTRGSIDWKRNRESLLCLDGSIAGKPGRVGRATRRATAGRVAGMQRVLVLVMMDSNSCT